MTLTSGLKGGIALSSSPYALIALDIDGVLNVLSQGSLTGVDSCVNSEHQIRWYPETISRLRGILSRPDVEAAWLTTWLTHPQWIQELEERLGLYNTEGDPLIAHRALHPIPDWRSDLFPEDVSLTPGPQWWKHFAAAELLDRFEPTRFAWLDDDLSPARGASGHRWRPRETSEMLLLRTHAAAGLSPTDCDRLERWLSRGHRPRIIQCAHGYHHSEAPHSCDWCADGECLYLVASGEP